MAENFADEDDLFQEDFFDDSYNAPFKQSFSDEDDVAPQIDDDYADEVELVAEPVEETSAEKAAFAAGFMQAVSAFGTKKAKKAVGRHAGAHAAPAKKVAAEAAPEADDEDISYEEPVVDRSGMALKKTSAGGRHAAGGAHAIGSHAAKPAKPKKPKKEKVVLTPEQKAARKAKRNRILKKTAKIGGISVASLALVAVIGTYAAGVVYFGKHVMPGVTVMGEDVSMMDTAQAAAVVDQEAADYRVSISGDDFYLQVKGEDIGFKVDSDQLVSKILEENPKWLWPFKLKETRNYKVGGYCNWDNEALAAEITDYTEAHNPGVSPSKDAYIDFSAEDDRFVVFKEVVGCRYNPARVAAAATVVLYDMGSHVDLGDEALLMPELYQDDPELNAGAEACNGFLGANFDLVVTVEDFWSDGHRVVDHIGNAELAQWIHLDESGNAYFDKEAMMQWCEEYVETHYTHRIWRKWTRPDGVELEMAYGTYGWKYDKNEFYNRLTAAILCDKVGQVEVPCEQAAHIWIDEDHPLDFPMTYVDIEISTQIVRYYEDGEEVWRAPTVSGDINSDQGTPFGVFYITSYMKRNTHLKGENMDGTPYDVPVDYWMPFINNMVGLHDNPNRTIFGWPWAFRDAGSHGCCNLPHDKAAALYQLIEPGTVVIVHW